MPKNKAIPLLTVVFDSPITPGKLRYFRGAVAEAVNGMVANGSDITEKQARLFHNHGEDEGKVINRYPFIQYQVIRRQPALTGIAEGAKVLSTFLLHKPQTLKTDRGEIKLKVAGLENHSWLPNLGDTRQYILNKWLPLNGENYQAWNNTDKLTERVEILNKVLWGNLFELADELGFTLDRKKLEVYCTSIDHKTFKPCYGQNLLALDIVFTTNLNLPEEIGIGHGKSIGFGKVRHLLRKNVD